MSSVEDIWVCGMGPERGRTERKETVQKGGRETESHRSGRSLKKQAICSSAIHDGDREPTKSLYKIRRCLVQALPFEMLW